MHKGRTNGREFIRVAVSSRRVGRTSYSNSRLKVGDSGVGARRGGGGGRGGEGGRGGRGEGWEGKGGGWEGGDRWGVGDATNMLRAARQLDPALRAVIVRARCWQN